MTVPLPPVDQPPNCAMFQPSGSSNRSANSNNNRRLTRGLGTSHFSSIAFLSLFFGLVPRLLCGRSTDRVSGRHVAHNFFFFFLFYFTASRPLWVELSEVARPSFSSRFNWYCKTRTTLPFYSGMNVIKSAQNLQLTKVPPQTST